MKSREEIDNLIRAAASAADEALPGLYAERKILLSQIESIEMSMTLLRLVSAAAQHNAAQ